MKYIVPEYYKDFNCKCGECRHSCCDGWPISISMKEYYFLIGINCSEKLRTKLDCALKIRTEHCNSSFALISTDWRGICMLHREDGLCALQVELGESSLPSVCRLYPRSTKQLDEIHKCSCSNSCEEVVELLIHFKKPLQFEETDLSFDSEFVINLPTHKYDCCKTSIAILQDRNMPLSERLITLGNFLFGVNFKLKRSDNLSIALQLLLIINLYFESSISISDYCKETQRYFDIEGKEKLSDEDLNTMMQRHQSASQHLETILPDWQVVLEQLIVNHMFYNNFPYSNNKEKATDAYLSLVIIYSFLRFHILGFMFNKTDSADLVDFFAAMFRLIEHSNFKTVSAHLLKKEKYSELECLPQLLNI